MRQRFALVALGLLAVAAVGVGTSAAPNHLPKHHHRRADPWSGDEGAEWRSWFQQQTGRAFVQSSDVTSDTVFPKPASLEQSNATFVVSPDAFSFQQHSQDPRVKEFLTRAFARYQRLVFPWSEQSGVSCDAEPTAVVVSVEVETNSVQLNSTTSEAHSLRMEARGSSMVVAIRGVNVFGAIRGLETFTQLVTFNVTSRCYAVSNHTIADVPRFPFRGVMVDVARNFMTLDNLFNLVDLMGTVKLNALHLHLTDDQGWTLDIPAYPRLVRLGAQTNHSHSYTLGDMASLVAFAMDRGVRVIPEVDVPGHSGKLCLAYPNLCSHYTDPLSGREHVGTFDPTNEEGWEFLRGVYSALGTVFVDDEVHVGGDEVRTKAWSENKQIREWMAEHEKSCPDDPILTCGTVTGLHHYFTRRLIGLLRSQGKRIIGWTPGISGFPVGDGGDVRYDKYPDVTLSNWRGFFPPGHAIWALAMEDLTTRHAPVILSGPFYVTDRWPIENWGNLFSWHDMYHTDPRNFTSTDSQKALVRGGELCVWDDSARTDSGNLVPKVGLLLTVFAEALWSPNGTVVPTDFPHDDATAIRIKDHRCRLVPRGITFEPVELIGVPCPEEFVPAPTSPRALHAENLALAAQIAALRREGDDAAQA